ncbi:unnamed protein product [Mytilus coruscus]|uniref:VWF/SSPO/Zonadhesin-like cysteine-rich domain-containing protein n=1 Tax=Mytilus coruscus TaxID=42192 RepID=A0A6J8E3R1_MYTCO|nr:unnamed protein product [Mytilus coruscus]
MDDPCTGILDQYVERMEYCGMLHIKNQAHSPFRDCIEDHQDLAETLYASCRYDVCAYYHDVQRRNKIVCESLNSLAAECESRGVIVKWRRENFCPMSCPSNMRYSTGVSGCPATCLDPNPDPAKCLFPPTEGCQCLPGFVSSGDNCVPVDECGCQSNMGYIPVGKSMMTLDCSHPVEM